MSRGVTFGAACRVPLGRQQRVEGVLPAPDYDVARVLDEWESRPGRAFDIEVDPLLPDASPSAPVQPPAAGRRRLEWLIGDDQNKPRQDPYAGFPGMRREPVTDTGGPAGAALTDYTSGLPEPTVPEVTGRVGEAVAAGDVNAGRSPEMVARDALRTEQADRMRAVQDANKDRRWKEGWVPWYQRRALTPQEKVLDSPLTPAEQEVVRQRYTEEMALLTAELEQRRSTAGMTSAESVRYLMSGELQRARYDALPDALIAEVKLARLERVTPRGRREGYRNLGPDAEDPIEGRMTRGQVPPPGAGVPARLAREKARRPAQQGPDTSDLELADLQRRDQDIEAGLTTPEPLPEQNIDMYRPRQGGSTGSLKRDPFAEPYVPQSDMEWELIKTRSQYRMRRNVREEGDTRRNTGVTVPRQGQKYVRPDGSIDPGTPLRPGDNRRGMVDPLDSDTTERAGEARGISEPDNMQRDKYVDGNPDAYAERRLTLTTRVIELFEERTGRTPSSPADFAMIDRIVDDRLNAENL